MAQINEKVFQKFNELPSNARMMVINQMEASDRCRLTRCSKSAEKEAKTSRSYIYGLDLLCFSLNIIIQVIYQKNEHGFILEFCRSSKKNVKRCRRLDYEILWEVELDDSKDLFQYAIAEFKNRLQLHQNIIKKLQINKPLTTPEDYEWKDVDLEINDLKNLEILAITGDFDVQQIFSKLQEPLNELAISFANSKALRNIEQIYQVKNALVWKDANFEKDQIRRLAAKKLITNTGNLTEKDIFSFLRSWQNGTIGKDIEIYRWNFNRLSFKIENLLRLLRICDVKEPKIEIKHYMEPETSAVLTWTRNRLIFDTRLDI